ncbi:MAG: SDR family oxidoreductase, partial [Actinobacteria bacterium]|nr:SDR family oxidoreductase [Actinomycetota bacterium]
MRLQDQVAVVTGGASGIGRACALALAREGAHVAVADLNLDGALQVAVEIEQLGRKAVAQRVDATRAEDLDAFLASAEQHLGPLTIWVGSAGVSTARPFLEQGLEEWRRVMAVNVDGVVFGAQAAARRMIARRRGSIINIASMFGTRGIRARMAYCVSKAAVIMSTQ